MEEADFAAARELFGGADRSLDDFLPKSLKDMDDFAQNLFYRYAAAEVRPGQSPWQLQKLECCSRLWNGRSAIVWGTINVI